MVVLRHHSCRGVDIKPNFNAKAQRAQKAAKENHDCHLGNRECRFYFASFATFASFALSVRFSSPSPFMSRRRHLNRTSTQKRKGRKKTQKKWQDSHLEN